MEQKRINEKLEFALDRLEKLQRWIKGPLDEKTKFACFKAFQEVIGAITDADALIIKLKGKEIEDDYTNIDKIVAEKMLSEMEASVLREANGLRNRIIHKYNKTEDSLALSSIKQLLPRLKQIIEKLGS